jgi:hypothetical protein
MTQSAKFEGLVSTNMKESPWVELSLISSFTLATFPDAFILAREIDQFWQCKHFILQPTEATE